MVNVTEMNMNSTQHPVTISVEVYNEKMNIAANKKIYNLD